jgi:hypothetical protein
MELIRPVPDCAGLNIVNISDSRTCGDGTAEEAAAWVAYCNGKPADTTRIGVDSAGKDWQTAGYWAAKRAENGHLELNSWEPGSAEPLFDNNFRQQKVFVKDVKSPEIADGVIRGRLPPHSLTRFRIVTDQDTFTTRGRKNDG